MNINKLTRMMEKYANSSDIGRIDFVFHNSCIIRHDVIRIHDDRLVVISCKRYGSFDNFETVASIIYEKELLGMDCKFIGIEALSLAGVEKALESYAYTAMTYNDLMKDVLISQMCSDKVWQAYKADDVQILNELNNGNIDFIGPDIIEFGCISSDIDYGIRDEKIVESSLEISSILETLSDYLKDIHNFKELILTAKTTLITNDSFWQELKISKSYIFGEMHLVFARRHCAMPEQYMNGYIVKLSKPNGMGEYLDEAMKDIVLTCEKVSSTPATFTLEVIRQTEF